MPGEHPQSTLDVQFSLEAECQFHTVPNEPISNAAGRGAFRRKKGTLWTLSISKYIQTDTWVN